MHSRLLVLDIETVPDRERLPTGFDPAAFPKPLFHRPVAVSFLLAAILREGATERFVVEECRSGGTETSTEAELLRGFWSMFGREKPRVVSWNGRGFDMAVLKQRAFLHGLPLLQWHQAGDKWNTYGQRYASDWHCDLMEALCDYGATPKLGLDETAHAVGLPGKIGGHGSEVRAMVDAGRVAEVRAYCEVDVLNTFLLYLRWCYLTGRVDVEGYDESVASLVALLNAERGERPHFGTFLDACDRNGAHMSIVRTHGARSAPVSDGHHLSSEDVLS